MVRTAAMKIGMCLGVVLMVLLMDVSMCCGQSTSKDDVVYLKDGGIIRGTIIELVPGKSLKIETRDGNVFVFVMDKVARLTKESPRNNAITFQGVGRKSGGVAFLLSLLITGGGQFYNGEAVKGGMMLGMSVLGFVLVVSSSESGGYNPYGSSGSQSYTVAGATLLLGSVLWSLIDAPISSARINRENGLASLYRVSDNLHVDLNMSKIGSQNTPCVRAVLSF